MSIGPNSLGFVTVASAGTPVQLVSSAMRVRCFRVQPRKNATTVNVGNVYIGGSNLNVSTKTGIYAILSPEQTEGIEIRYPQDLTDISQWYVDADNSNDSVLVGVTA